MKKYKVEKKVSIRRRNKGLSYCVQRWKTRLSIIRVRINAPLIPWIITLGILGWRRSVAVGGPSRKKEEENEELRGSVTTEQDNKIQMEK